MLTRIPSEWVFRRQANPNACEVQFRVTFEVASFLHANAIQLFFDDVAVTQLNAFIGRTAKLQSLHRRSAAQTQQVSPPQKQQQQASPQAPTTPTSGAASTTATPRQPAGAPTARAVQTASTASENPSDSLLPDFHKAAAIIREDVWSQDYERLRQTFCKYAVDNEKLYFGAFVKACRELGCDHDDLRHIGENSALAGAIFSSFEYCSTPKDWLNLEEFTVGVYLMTKGTAEEKAHTLFHIIDVGGDGKISRDELRHAMERRIRTVKNIFPKLLADQVKLQMEGSNSSTQAVGAATDVAMTDGLAVIEKLMEEIEQDIPLAVNQIFLEADLDQDDFITQDEWLFAWQLHPEFVELMTIDGMKKVAQWASVVSTEDSDGDESDGVGGRKKDTRLTYVD
jgi:coenzyme Q-binding protein COQ10